MSQTSISINPQTTVCVLKNMSLAIDEIKLVRSIKIINEQVEAKDAAQLESGAPALPDIGIAFPQQTFAGSSRKSQLELSTFSVSPGTANPFGSSRSNSDP